MTEQPSQPETLVDVYLDGLMNERERADFERALADDPALRAAVEQQRDIDASIARLLPLPSEQSMRDVVTQACDEHAAPARFAAPSPGRALAVAAAVLLCLTGGWLIWRVAQPGPQPGGAYAEQPLRTLDEVYARALATGFEPTVVCRDDEEFESWFQQQFRRPLRLAPLPSGVAALGLGYSNSLSPGTIHLLAEADGERIIVFIDRLERRTDWRPPAGSGLHLHEAIKGDLVAYELSPLAAPRVLDHLYDPDDGGR